MNICYALILAKIARRNKCRYLIVVQQNSQLTCIALIKTRGKLTSSLGGSLMLIKQLFASSDRPK